MGTDEAFEKYWADHRGGNDNGYNSAKAAWDACRAHRDASSKNAGPLWQWLDDRAGQMATEVAFACDIDDDEKASWYGGRAHAFREVADRVASAQPAAPALPEGAQWDGDDILLGGIRIVRDRLGGNFRHVTQDGRSRALITARAAECVRAVLAKAEASR